jgi:hypothetical protein
MMDDVSLSDATRANPAVDPDTLRVYYSCQYDRAGRHEANRLTLSSYVIGGSVVAVGLLSGRGAGDSDVRIITAASVALINLLGIAFVSRSAWWVRVHLARVHMSLCELSPRLADLQYKSDKAQGMRNPRGRYAPRQPASPAIHTPAVATHEVSGGGAIPDSAAPGIAVTQDTSGQKLTAWFRSRKRLQALGQTAFHSHVFQACIHGLIAIVAIAICLEVKPS